MKREQTGLAGGLVAQVSNLLYRRFPIGNLWTSGRTRNHMTMIVPILLCLLIGFSPRAHAADALTEALQKGLFEEEANQNLEAAIKAYQDVLGRAEEQRRIAATALFRLAECYRKQGKTNEASGEYRRLVRDYSEQTTLVNLSRQNLVGLGVNTAVAASAQNQNSDPLTTDEEQQEIQRIRTLIKNSPDLINARNRTISGSTKGTVLHEAAYKGHLLVVEYLLANGADINVLDTSKATPLYHAAGNGHKKMVELLLAKGAQASPIDAGQPLHAAVERGFQGVVEVLLAHKVDVNAARGMTALHLAIKEKNQRIAELLLTNGANPNAVYTYFWKQGPALINSLGTLDGTPLHFAVQGGSPALARLLIARGADVNALTDQGLTSLHYAQNPSLNLEIAKNLVEILLAAGAKIDAAGKEGQLSGWTPLLVAVNHKIPQLVQLLLDKGADPNVPLRLQAFYEGANEWALNMAVRDGGAPEIVELLLKNKADVNARDYNRETPLLGAIGRNPNPAILDLLLAHKADMSARNAGGNTALAMAVHANNLATAELLLSKGANANDTNVYGFPMLHVALGAQPPTRPGQPVPYQSISSFPPQMLASGGPPQPIRVGTVPPPTKKPDKTMLQLLLEHKADPNQFDNVRDKESETAFQLAVHTSNLSAAELLLEHKADPNSRTDSGITPLHWAAANNHEPMVDLLLANKASPAASEKGGETPLHWVVDRGETNIIAKLVQSGADVNACTAGGDTPLRKMIRARNPSTTKDYQAVEILLKLGASVVKKCDNHSSAFEESVTRNVPRFTELLRKYHPAKLALVKFEGPVKQWVWFWEADKTMTLSEAIAGVGLQDTADPTRITIWRNDPVTGLTKSTPYNLVMIREKFAGVDDVALKDGDKVYVTARPQQ